MRFSGGLLDGDHLHAEFGGALRRVGDDPMPKAPAIDETLTDGAARRSQCDAQARIIWNVPIELTPTTAGTPLRRWLPSWRGRRTWTWEHGDAGVVDEGIGTPPSKSCTSWMSWHRALVDGAVAAGPTVAPTRVQH
jgi:hypothetical protein